MIKKLKIFLLGIFGGLIIIVLSWLLGSIINQSLAIGETMMISMITIGFASLAMILMFAMLIYYIGELVYSFIPKK